MRLRLPATTIPKGSPAGARLERSATRLPSQIHGLGGFFSTGVIGPLWALQIVTYAFPGIEMIGVTAGEARNPREELPKAINRVAWRILLFYIGAIAAILMLIPWRCGQ